MWLFDTTSTWFTGDGDRTLLRSRYRCVMSALCMSWLVKLSHQFKVIQYCNQLQKRNKTKYYIKIYFFLKFCKTIKVLFKNNGIDMRSNENIRRNSFQKNNFIWQTKYIKLRGKYFKRVIHILHHAF